VHKRVDGDVRFPPIDRGVWREIARDEHAAASGDEAALAFVTYARAAAAAPRPPSAA